jgi:hypothetical protein
MADDYKDLAYTTVSTAPSPNTSGTTLTVASGTGADLPNVPFMAVAVRVGQVVSKATAEMVRVTALSGDTITAMTRAQGGTTAKSIGHNWAFFAAITEKNFDDLWAAVAARMAAGTDNAATTATKITTTPSSGNTRTGVAWFDAAGAQLIQTVTLAADATGGTTGTDELTGTPLALKYDVEYTGTPADGIVGAVTYNSFTNPWVSGGSTYGEQPEGPRSILSVEGTTQWNQASSTSGSAVPLLNVWYTYKNKAGVAKDLGSNALTQLTPMFLADGATVGMNTIADVIAPNIASEYLTTTFKGYWGWMSNPWHGSINGGHLNASTAISVGFMSEAMFMGNTTWGTVHDVQLRELWMANGLGSQSATTPTVDTHVGIYMQPFTAATTNLSMVLNNGVRLLDVDRTFTAKPWTGNGVSVSGNAWLSMAGTHTLDFSNASIGVLIQQNATIKLNHSSNAVLMSATVQDNNTYQNVAGVTANLGITTVLSGSHTFKAVSATLTQPKVRTVHSSPTFSQSSGSLTTTDVVGLEADIQVDSGTAVTNRYGLKFNTATASGTTRITNQYGVYVPVLLTAANNYGIWNGSTTVWQPSTAEITAVGDSIGIAATLTHLNNSSGAAKVLTSTPSIAASTANGQVAYIVNNDTAQAVTLQDSTKLSGSGVKLVNAETSPIPQYGAMQVMWNTTANQWIEVGRPGIAPDGRINICTSQVGVTVLRYYGGQNTLDLERSGGTYGSPSAVGSGNVLAAVNFSGVRTVSGTSGTAAAGAVVQATTTQAWTGSNNGTKLELYTTPNNSTTNTVALTLDQDQSLTPGNTSGTKTNFKIGYSTRRYARSFYR